MGISAITNATMVVHELEGVLVAGAVAKDSIEHDLKGKHHKRGLHCLRLLQLKERDNLGSKTRENLEIKKTSLNLCCYSYSTGG